MMRLIDADALKDMMLQAYIDALPEFDMPWKKKMAHSVTLSVMADIDEAPTVDAEPVVRCQDCKWRPHNMGKGEDVHHLGFPWDDSGEEVCPYSAGDPWYNREPDPNGFCHLGEREVIDN